MGSGKSTAIKALAEHLGHPVELIKFAQPLYDMQEFIYSRIESVYQRPADFIKDRKLLQWLGTEWGRDSISKTIWGDIWQAKLKVALDKGFVVVCDDVRFDNEAARFKALGGKIIHIVSERTHERIDTGAGIVNHQSEAGIAHEFVDAVVPNNTTVEDFRVSLAQVFDHFSVGNSE